MRTALWRAALGLLHGGGDAQALLSADQVVIVVEADVELYPVHLAGEAAVLARVVLAYRGARVIAHVARLVAGVNHRNGRLDAAFPGLVAVDV